MQPQNNKDCRSLEQRLKEYIAVKDINAAVDIARQLAGLFPRNRVIWEHIISVFIDGGQTDEAEKALTFMKEHFKPHPIWHLFQANIAYQQKNYEQALVSGRQGLSDDSLSSWQRALLYNVLSFIETELGNPANAAAYELAASKLPYNPSARLNYSSMLFFLHYLELPQQKIFQALKGYNDLLADIKPYKHAKTYNHSKIRVGYVSSDFCYSVVASFIYVMLASYDKARFEVYAYAKVQEDDISGRLADCVDVWRNINTMSAQEAAALIYRDEIDILFEPSGHTANNCLEIMAYKPAPIQICGVGWFDSTGMEAMDYFLTDVYVDPPAQNDEYFTEKLLRLPHSHFCYYLLRPLPAISPPPFLTNGYITFGTLNKFAKITDKMLAAWAKIMQQVPKSKLFLKGKTFDSALGRETAQKRMVAAGIEISRVIWEGHTDKYFSAYNKMDIALDTFPYPGGTTTCDALFVGVPVVTLVGKMHNSRFGYSLLKNMQLDELCADTLEKYIDICVKLANDHERLRDYRFTLPRRMRMSPLMDEGQYMVDLELLYESLAKRNKTAEVSMQKLAQYEKKGNWDELILAINARLAARAYRKDDEALLWGWLGEAYLASQQHGSLKRAKYCLQKALAAIQGKQRLIFLCYLCEVTEKTGDFALQYQAAHEAVGMLPRYAADLPAWWVSNLHVICAHSAMMLGKFDECEQEYWQGAETKGTLREQLDIMTSFILASHYQPYDSAEIWRRQQAYAQLIRRIEPLPPVQCRCNAGNKIRIGYISPNFHRHAMYPIYYGLFAYANRDRFSVTGYQLNTYTDEYTRRIVELADEWRNVSAMAQADIAQLVRADKIDILVDLASHLANTGLPVLAYRPARIQVSGLGSICTAGITSVDYFITDAIVDPPGMHDAYFAEKPLYLPAQFAYAGLEQAPSPQGAPCGRRGYIQFGVFQLFTKVTDEMLLVWKRIMDELPTARLLFKGASFNSDALAEFIYNRLKKLGMPLERIAFEGDSPYEEYLKRLQDVDIMLDTYPYTGGSTTLDALYMGVPTVTLYGERRGTRFGYSILKSVGLEELAVNNVDDYIRRVLDLAQDEELLDLLHRNLRQMMQKSDALSPRKYVLNMEKAYEEMLHY